MTKTFAAEQEFERVYKKTAFWLSLYFVIMAISSATSGTASGFAAAAMNMFFVFTLYSKSLMLKRVGFWVYVLFSFVYVMLVVVLGFMWGIVGGNGNNTSIRVGDQTIDAGSFKTVRVGNQTIIDTGSQETQEYQPMTLIIIGALCVVYFIVYVIALIAYKKHVKAARILNDINGGKVENIVA